MIRQLREEVDLLKAQLGLGPGSVQDAAGLAALRERLAESESLMREMNLSWEEKLQRAQVAMEERQRAMEEMGISIHKGGVKIDRSKYYLVNLNEDPAMSEMLVYYLKIPTSAVGKGPGQDVMLSGLGIQDHHATICIGSDGDVSLDPEDGAAVFVNGHPVTAPVPLRHGHRVLFGSNHLFRVACPRRPGDVDDEGLGWEQAQQELINGRTDAEWQEEKDLALEEQRAFYERRIAELAAAGLADDQVAREIADREGAQLKQELSEATRTLQQANILSKELGYPISFAMSLRISLPALLDPRSRGRAAREIAVIMSHVKQHIHRKRSLERFHAHLDFLRDVYQRKEEGEFDGANATLPSYFAPGGSELIGVAHFHLRGLEHGLDTRMTATIVGQDGRPAGTIAVHLTLEPKWDLGQAPDSSRSMSTDPQPLEVGDVLRARISVLEAHDIPPKLATFVNARYCFPGTTQEQMIPEDQISGYRSTGAPDGLVKFDPGCSKFFEVPVTPALLASLEERSVPIQVWGHSVHVSDKEEDPDLPSPTMCRRSDALGSARGGSDKAQSPPSDRAVSHSAFAQRWEACMHGFQVWIAVCELGDNGAYVPVPSDQRSNIYTGGILQIRRGHARRLVIRVSQTSGPPLSLSKVKNVRLGDIHMCGKLDASGDSFNEADVELVRER